MCKNRLRLRLRNAKQWPVDCFFWCFLGHSGLLLSFLGGDTFRLWFLSIGWLIDWPFGVQHINGEKGRI